MVKLHAGGTNKLGSFELLLTLVPVDPEVL